MTKDLVPAIPAALEKAGVTIAEQDGYRAVMFPPELRENFNVLLPTQEISQAVELIRPSIRAVELNPDFENGSHFYNQGTKSRPRLAPTKTALETLAFTAGLTLARTRPLRADELSPYLGESGVAFGFEATVAIRRPDGTPLEISRSKIWQGDVEHRKIMNAGLPDWCDTEEKRRVEREKRWLTEKEFAPAKTESKAVLRAIRAALQIPHTFTPEQAAKPFIVVGYDFALDYSDERMLRLVLERSSDREREVYGAPELPAASETAGETAGETTSSPPADIQEEAPDSETPIEEPPPLFEGDEPPEPEADPEPPNVSLELVLPDVFTRYPGSTIGEIVAAGDETYLKFLASKKVKSEAINAAAKAGLAALKEAKS